MQANQFLNEKEMMEWMDVNRKQLAYLRKVSGLPFIEIHRNVKMYPEKEVCEWLVNRINRNED